MLAHNSERRSAFTLGSLFLFISILVGFFLSIALYLNLSQAVVSITPVSKAQSLDLPFTLKEQAESSVFKEQTVAGQLHEVTFDVEREFRVPVRHVEGYAKGVVTLYNDRSSSQSLAKGTHLRSEYKDKKGDPIYFLLDEAVVLAGNSSLEASVTSKYKGEEYAIESSDFIIDRLNKAAWDVVYAESSEKMTGGLVEDHFLLKEDFDTAKTMLSDTLYAEATKRLSSEDFTYPLDRDSILLEFLEARSDTSPNTVAESFTYNLSLRATALDFDRDALLAFMIQEFSGLESPEQSYRDFIEESFTIKPISYHRESKAALFRASLDGNFNLRPPHEALDSSNVAGLTVANLNTFYSQFPSIEEISVSFWPFWVKRVPTWTKNIIIEVE